jgi:hypothetical protein
MKPIEFTANARGHVWEHFRALSLVTSPDGARPIIEGIAVQAGEEGLEFIATDSYQLMVWHSGEPIPDDFEDCIIPKIAHVHATKNKTQGFQLSFDEETVTIERTDGTSVRADMIQGDFPNWRALTDGVVFGTHTDPPSEAVLAPCIGPATLPALAKISQLFGGGVQFNSHPSGGVLKPIGVGFANSGASDLDYMVMPVRIS